MVATKHSQIRLFCSALISNDCYIGRVTGYTFYIHIFFPIHHLLLSCFVVEESSCSKQIFACASLSAAYFGVVSPHR